VANRAPVSVDSASVSELLSVDEHAARENALLGGIPFVVFRDGDGRQQIVTLRDDDREVVVGRGPAEHGIRLNWDPEVSRTHAVLERLGADWTIVDNGLSRNGTSVNECRVDGQRRLKDGDRVRCGNVVLEFHDPQRPSAAETVPAKGSEAPLARVSPGQRRVLVALCRPMHESRDALPATNKQIAAELCLSVDAVKTQLRRASEALGVESVQQNQKRHALALTAMSTVLTARDFDDR
jgi:FHA domain